MSNQPAGKKPRKPNPTCGHCSHAKSFHPRDPVKHRRPCKAFGCSCSDFRAPAKAET